jgi:CheY-like chemotaxis protein
LDKQPRILVVDDDQAIRSTMKTILQDEGCQVDIAENGKEAIEKSKDKFYNIAILDIRLPDMEGVELLKLLKNGVPRMRKILDFHRCKMRLQPLTRKQMHIYSNR